MNGLGGPVVSAPGLGHRALLHREQGLAGQPIQHEDHPHLGGLSHRRDHATVLFQGHQHRLGREIVVPRVVADRLVVPDEFSGEGVQHHQGVSVQVLTVTVASQGGGRGGEHPAPLRVHADDGPGVGAGTFFPRVSLPGLVSRLAGPGNGVKLPHQVTREHVPSPHLAAGSLVLLAGAEPGARDHHILVDGHRGSDRVDALGPARGHAPVQIHPSVLAEPGDQLPRLRIQREQLGVSRPHQDPPLKLPVDGSLPERDAPVLEVEAVVAAPFLRVELPELPARLRLQGDDPVGRRGQVEDSIHCQRRAFPRSLHPVGDGPVRALHLSHAVDPGHLQFLDVGPVDLSQSGVPGPPRVLAVVTPVVIVGGIWRRDAGRRPARAGAGKGRMLVLCRIS